MTQEEIERRTAEVERMFGLRLETLMNAARDKEQFLEIVGGAFNRGRAEGLVVAHRNIVESNRRHEALVATIGGPNGKS